ncbi:MAG: hypothetical protein R3313_00445 [Candidatus Saccharimonadales bacterium]|nr:hypothetical protein [Candidatus Saccharimonadales bacterium]
MEGERLFSGTEFGRESYAQFYQVIHGHVLRQGRLYNVRFGRMPVMNREIDEYNHFEFREVTNIKGHRTRRGLFLASLQPRRREHLFVNAEMLGVQDVFDAVEMNILIRPDGLTVFGKSKPENDVISPYLSILEGLEQLEYDRTLTRNEDSVNLTTLSRTIVNTPLSMFVRTK